MKVELNRQELKILIGWFKEATKGKYGLDDDPVGLTWEEEALLKKIKEAMRK